ncbi:peptide chain release factor-like protein, partial [Micromonospora sp. BL4]
MSTYLLLSAGRGPQECAWAVGRLRHRLTGDAGRQGLTVQQVQAVPGERPGTYRSVLIRIAGGDAEAFAASWTGT